MKKRQRKRASYCLRGKYQLAYMLVAGAKLTDSEIAVKLDVEVDALREAMSKRNFQQQVASIRNTEAILRSHGMRFKSSEELALLACKGRIFHAGTRISP
jgi:hypothetical protein